MRPIYENTTTLRSELEFSAKLQNRFGIKLQKTPISFGIDYAVIRGGKISSFIELKCRTNPMQKYSTYMIAAIKYQKSMSIMRDSGLPVRLWVQWSDATGFCELSKPGYEWNIGGRIDRNDAADIEPVIHIPIPEFKLVEI